ncbi:radical SAM protein [Solirubrobacter ginsenosidimutans]|uniref:Radical SAM protein n=1 Tax=Solirubrobacter ginsenosidimutans TaxID=490573 RepID=A0A9X3MXI1_9ACTN|nr:radical SAM protein [Solirubrobacter ginsenosidimutans]MDA0161273.1 radical SAM protein [Solirubrobacter ginsenosidimutans]
MATSALKRPEWVGYHEVPGILLVRLMSRCNEKCLFCMVADEIAYSDDVRFQEVADTILRQPPGTQIEFFGGEPTIYPRFLELLEIARTAGYRCSIASNLRIFHSASFTAKVQALGADEIYIRTSLYGDTPELHDYYTDVPGSHRQTLQGIHNIVAAGFECQVNIVILAENVDRLDRMVDQVHDWGVHRVKLGNLMSLDTCGEHGVRLSAVRPRLAAAIARAEAHGLSVTVEKTPICVASGRIDLLSTERMIYDSDRVYDDAGACSGCLVRRWCDGFDPGYVDLFGFDGIQTLDHVPAAALRRTPAPEPELLKMHCVEIADNEPDEATQRELYELSRVVLAKHGCLAVFPREYVAT